jgi:hypothetical protein
MSSLEIKAEETAVAASSPVHAFGAQSARISDRYLHIAGVVP